MTKQEMIKEFEKLNYFLTNESDNDLTFTFELKEYGAIPQFLFINIKDKLCALSTIRNTSQLFRKVEIALINKIFEEGVE